MAFVTGGYTGASNLFSTSSAGNAGVGVNAWLARDFGIRTESRGIFNGSAQVWMFRGSLALR